ncbi:DNA polymerase-3 subunit delta' [Thermolongibacillus altinsuensis]|jgi:DNA polymerase-3 subunit delta'|uniref:DNA polymerase III subunit delta' n=1 Tax=Thermolongibacillus altinsuensis TaxID=575256 RepID=A0A4R1QEN4_9BACL|nr:DNA polymerase III subunit delta' [Thermolongibacillus altinsuensis]TCL46071.1 DNA polymerase-3 subunit delta' [Thermolongibacillus altinsuensis]
MSMSWEQLEQYQPNALRMIANSIQKGRVAHAYLFEGQRGTGKKEASLLFAKSLFCLNRSTYKPCYQCINCRRIDSGNHPDVHIVAPDGQSIKKHQIDQLQEEFTKTAMESNKKLYIIEHADQMTVNAANSLLKFLEEPSSNTIAILLTEQLHRMLNTIISRCQIISFKPLPTRILTAYLEEQGIPRHIAVLAAHVTNSRQEALELSQSDWFAQARKIVLQLYEALNKSYIQALFVIQDQWLPHFADKEQMSLGLDLLLYLYKDLLYIQTNKEEKMIYDDCIAELKQYSFLYSQKRVIENMSAILRAKARLNTNMNPQLLMEQLALQLREGSTFV